MRFKDIARNAFDALSVESSRALLYTNAAHPSFHLYGSAVVGPACEMSIELSQKHKVQGIGSIPNITNCIAVMAQESPQAMTTTFHLEGRTYLGKPRGEPRL